MCNMIQDISSAFASHRDWLHRWFMARGIDAFTADDLVQLTLLEAWRNHSKLDHDDGMQPWLRAIAHHVMKRWWRSAARDARLHQLIAAGCTEQYLDIPDARLPEPCDLLEHEDLAAFVGNALSQLPAATRDLVRARYQDDLPLADLADQIGISPAHVAVRLQRARDQLRTILSQSFSRDLKDYGFDPIPVVWRSTRLWCPVCGTSRLSMELDATAGVFALKCPRCTSGPGDYLYNWRLMDSLPYENPLRSARSAVQALERTKDASVWKAPPIGHHRLCPRCQGQVTCRATLPPSVNELGNLQLEMWCPSCGPLHASATYGGMATFHPQGMAFWEDHKQIRSRPPVWMRFDQTDAIRVDLVSSSSNSTLTFVFSDLGERLLQIIPDA